MNPSRIFILRPVATSLLMVAVMLIGALAFQFLPLSALPEVDYPTIQVQTFYPGASPDVMTSSVTAPLERQFGEMPGLVQMSSTSSAGASVITLQFSLDLSLDIAEQEVQAAINAAGNLLPSDLPAPPIYAKVNPADAPILTLALTSKTLPLPQIEDAADTRLAQKISQLPGVGLVMINGGQRPAVRIQADTRKLAAYGLNIDDLRTTIANANVDTPKGSFDGPTRAYAINANDQLQSAAAYMDLIVAYKNGDPVRLKDVAKSVQASENNRLTGWAGTTPAVILNIERQPGANVIAVVDRIKALLPQFKDALPADVDMAVLTDRTVTIRASVHDVEFELSLAVVLVVLVIFVFLRSTRATLIPSLSVPLSIVGTFAAMYLLGFSLNNLSLMALTIASGFVVDDAIVMIENIQRYIEEGEAPLEAALKGSHQVGFTIISLTISLIAVLIPLLFMGDVVGRLFREFAITLSVTILISAAVSLTVVPMACARFLKPPSQTRESRFQRWARLRFEALIESYGRWLAWVLDRQGATLLVAVATLVLTAVLYIVIPKGFFPVQDTGLIQGISEAAQTISYDAMASEQEALVAAILKDPDVESVSSFIGVDGTNTTLNSGRVLINLKPKDKRSADVTSVMQRIQQETEDVPGISLYMQPVQDLTIDTIVSRTEYQFILESADPVALANWVPKLVDKLNATPEVTDVASDLAQNGLSAYIDIDRETAARFGITPATIDNALYDAFGQRIVSTIFTQSNQYRVILEADPSLQNSVRDLSRHISPVIDRQRAGAAFGDRACARGDGAAADRPSGAIPGGAGVVQSGARRVPRRGGRRDPRGGAGDRIAAKHRPQFPGRCARVPVLARERAVPHPRRDRHRLYRAGRAVRKLRPSGDDHLDLAVGRDRRASGAHPLRQRTHRHRHHRHRPPHRHRQEERDHDDRLRLGCGEERGHERARCDLSRLAPALPADPDDDDGGNPGRAAADDRHRHRRRAAPSPGPHHRRRPHREPDAHSFHHAGHLSCLRPARGAARRPRRRGRRRRGRAAMTLSETFIRRPVATMLLTLGVALAGGIAFFRLPVSPLPQVDLPTISVQAQMPGAAPRSWRRASRRPWSAISAPSPTSPR